MLHRLLNFCMSLKLVTFKRNQGLPQNPKYFFILKIETFLDEQPPVISSCPSDIYIFEDETPKWREPYSYDNVGINGVEKPDLYPTFSAGVHRQSYRVYDFDNNKAECMFSVVVSTRGRI